MLETRYILFLEALKSILSFSHFRTCFIVRKSLWPCLECYTGLQEILHLIVHVHKLNIVSNKEFVPGEESDLPSSSGC